MLICIKICQRFIFQKQSLVKFERVICLNEDRQFFPYCIPYFKNICTYISKAHIIVILTSSSCTNSYKSRNWPCVFFCDRFSVYFQKNSLYILAWNYLYNELVWKHVIFQALSYSITIVCLFTYIILTTISLF